MFINDLSKREKILFYSTVSIISISLIYSFTFRKTAGLWNELNQEITAKKIKLRKNIQYLLQEDSVRRNYQEYAPYIIQRGSNEEQMRDLLNQVERAARSADIRIANLKPRPIENKGFYNKYGIELNCEADIEQYTEFIYNLQGCEQLIRIERLKLSSQANSPALKAQMLISKVAAQN